MVRGFGNPLSFQAPSYRTGILLSIWEADFGPVRGRNVPNKLRNECRNSVVLDRTASAPGGEQMNDGLRELLNANVYFIGQIPAISAGRMTGSEEANASMSRFGFNLP